MLTPRRLAAQSWIDTLHYIKDEFTGYWSYRPTTQHSTKGALTVIWKFLYENPDSTRIETIKALSARGMNKGTVSTEFYRFRHAAEGERRNRANSAQQ